MSNAQYSGYTIICRIVQTLCIHYSAQSRGGIERSVYTLQCVESRWCNSVLRVHYCVQPESSRHSVCNIVCRIVTILSIRYSVQNRQDTDKTNVQNRQDTMDTLSTVSCRFYTLQRTIHSVLMILHTSLVSVLPILHTIAYYPQCPDDSTHQFCQCPDDSTHYSVLFIVS